MRLRKTNFGVMPFNAFKKLMTERRIWGFTVKCREDILTYTFHVMFRNNRYPPETLYVDVSTRSRNVVSIRSDIREFISLDDMLEKTKLKS